MSDYVYTELVKAEPMTSGEYFEKYSESVGFKTDSQEKIPDDFCGYGVYIDGNLEMWVSNNVFEENFHSVGHMMFYDAAYLAMSKKLRIKRKCWEGHYVRLYKGPDNIKLLVEEYDGIEGLVMTPYTPTSEDLVADDWQTV